MSRNTIIRRECRRKGRKRCERDSSPRDLPPRHTKRSDYRIAQQAPIDSREEELWGTFRRLFEGTLDF